MTIYAVFDEIDIEGENIELYVDATGISDLDISIAGSGEIVISVRDELSIGISGSESVHFYGSPTVSQETSGVSPIKHISPNL